MHGGAGMHEHILYKITYDSEECGFVFNNAGFSEDIQHRQWRIQEFDDVYAHFKDTK